MRQMREGNLRLNHFLASIWFVGCQVSAARVQTSEKQCALESVAARDQTTRPESRHFNLAHFESIKVSHRQCHQSGRLHGRRPGLLNEPSSIPAVKNTTFVFSRNATSELGTYIAPTDNNDYVKSRIPLTTNGPQPRSSHRTVAVYRPSTNRVQTRGRRQPARRRPRSSRRTTNCESRSPHTRQDTHIPSILCEKCARSAVSISARNSSCVIWISAS